MSGFEFCACAVHGHVKPLVTAFFGNYTLQDLLGATQAFRLAAAQLRAEGRTSQPALDKLVGLRDGTDALGAARPLSCSDWPGPDKPP